jgi:cell division protein FtsW
VAVVGLLGALVAKEDLGTAITLVCTGLLMIFMMGARLLHMAGLLVAAGAAGVGFLMAEPYRMERVYGWLDLIYRPLVRHDDVNYQPWQGLVALGSGGPTGQGLGRGVAKYMYLPAEHTDYIFATIGEETGLWGTLGLLALFAYVLIRGLTIAHRTRDWFGSLAAAGMVSLVGIQALLNMAVVTCLVPCTGVPLPFISYGGSSLVFTALALGIVLNISQSSQRAPAGADVRQSRESRADGWRNRRAHLSRT